MKPRRGKKDYSHLEYHCLVRRGAPQNVSGCCGQPGRRRRRRQLLSTASGARPVAVRSLVPAQPSAPCSSNPASPLLAPHPPPPPPQVRATDGKRKLSTVVQGAELARFHESYTTIQRVRRLGVAAGRPRAWGHPLLSRGASRPPCACSAWPSCSTYWLATPLPCRATWTRSRSGPASGTPRRSREQTPPLLLPSFVFLPCRPPPPRLGGAARSLLTARCSPLLLCSASTLINRLTLCTTATHCRAPHM